MKYIIVAIIGLLLLSTCTCSKDKYRKEISGIFILHWDFRPIPQRGIVYMYKKNTHFTEFIDTVNFIVIKRGRVDSTELACLLYTKKLNHLNDIQVVLDDTLVYDISNIGIEKFLDTRRRGMWGPIERDIIPSLLVNGCVTRDTTVPGELAFPQKCGRIIRKR